MARLLHIDSSPRGERSHSRRLTREFVETWKQSYDEFGGMSLTQSIANARTQLAQLVRS
jgi:FMN-dependent NADH-azoreductase